VNREARPRALVTGGAGFLGGHLCERLIAEGYLVLCVDDLSTGVRENVAHLEGDPGFEFVHHDITSPLRIEERLDEVYHFASPASPKDFDRIPVQILLAGSAGTHNAPDLAQARGARFLLASSSEV
jgi:dTDP-glucose 4,6-dehydratase